MGFVCSKNESTRSSTSSSIASGHDAPQVSTMSTGRLSGSQPVVVLISRSCSEKCRMTSAESTSSLPLMKYVAIAV